MDDAERWTTLCRNFHTIRERSYAYGLRDRWLALADGPATPTTLSAWWALLTELEQRRTKESSWTIRRGDEDADDWRLEWDDPEPPSRYRCPTRRCRREDKEVLETPRCWLDKADMLPEP